MVEVPKSTRSYGCVNGDGNPYDFVVTVVNDMSTLALCSPCFIRTAMNMLEAMSNPDNPEVQQMLSEAGDAEQVPMYDDGIMPLGHNAPVDAQDPDAIEEFAGYVLEDELPDDMRA